MGLLITKRKNDHNRQIIKDKTTAPLKIQIIICENKRRVKNQNEKAIYLKQYLGVINSIIQHGWLYFMFYAFWSCEFSEKQ